MSVKSLGSIILMCANKKDGGKTNFPVCAVCAVDQGSQSPYRQKWLSIETIERRISSVNSHQYQLPLMVMHITDFTVNSIFV